MAKKMPQLAQKGSAVLFYKTIKWHRVENKSINWLIAFSNGMNVTRQSWQNSLIFKTSG